MTATRASIESITIPSTVKSIFHFAFADCAKLKSVVLHEGLEEIGARAFSNSGLHTVSFPSSLKKIGRDAFRGTTLTFKDTPDIVYACPDAFDTVCCDMSADDEDYSVWAEWGRSL